ncbi:unnamed protein product [Microthlaspi erraticum]|uniref:Reverse transcriptase domain-containing protein n=1 Tax=Microthlaspi erraticum TaxID=1685480 RepID=A0A6D2HVD8_9BRAS|nr:unnamed protein product [Microthlaspi erraticum]
MELVKSHAPDIIFLMETKNKEEEILRLLPLTDYVPRFVLPPNSPGSGGLALYWKQEISLQVLSSCKSYIDTSITYKGNTFFSTFVYGEPDFSLRKEVWDEVTNLGLVRDKPWFLTRDFNDIIDISEKSGGKQQTEASFGDFRAFISQSDLYDLQHTGNFLSWRGVRYTHLVHCRLDLAMANSMWLDLYPSSRCHYLDFEGSDHRPIFTELQPEKKKKRGIFRYDRAMRHNTEISKLIDATWNKVKDDSVERRINNCRKAISYWNRKNHVNNRKLIEEEKANLERAMSASAADPALIQRRDKNSGYFHAITRGRKAINKFLVLEEKEGQPVYEEDDFVRVISAYFQDIFITRSTQCTYTVNRALKPCISYEVNDSLIAIPSNEEIRAALFAIHPDKAPGPDGFSASFFQTNWLVVKEKMTSEIRDFFISGSLPTSINKTYVRLIPKVKSPKTVAEYRPIALCNVFYKIISKLLTKRLQPILPTIISENQTAFVPGRAISDNVLITHETLHYLKGSKATKYCSMAVKTDMSKAYDRLEWNFITTVLERMGFHAKWINWIFQCISTVSYSFLVNGTAQGSVIPQRGIRQGDPLSPFIFILCGEVLTGLCNNAQVGLIPGIKVAKESPRINHLLFADDTMFFCQTKLQCCDSLASILRQYEEASGQQINKQKSSITFSSKTPQDIRVRVKQTLGIETEGGQGKYLGLPESFSRKKKDLFSVIVDRIRQKAVHYASRRLSIAGKLTLIKSVLSAIPTYSMSSFKLPLGRAIGNGQSTSLWNDSWLSHTTPLKPLGPPNLQDKDATVASLINASGWDKQKIEDLIPHHLPQIMSIRPSLKGAQDCYVWIPSKSGDYTVKTGYHISRSLREQPAGNIHTTINWNADIWLGHLSLKIKLFLRKILHKALPMGENLLNRGLLDSACCIHCGELETDEHLFFRCEFARKVWALAPFSKTIDLTSINFEASVTVLKRLICLPPTGISSGPLSPWIFWTIWSARNHRLFENRPFSPEESNLKAIQDAREWQEAQIPEKKLPLANLSLNTKRLHPDTVVCFTDGSWLPETTIAGTGWIFTTMDGTQIDAGSLAEPFASSPLMAEAIAIRSALIQALEKNFLHLQIKSDAHDLI